MNKLELQICWKDTQSFPLNQLSHGPMVDASRMPEGPGRVLELVGL